VLKLDDKQEGDHVTFFFLLDKKTYRMEFGLETLKEKKIQLVSTIQF
jgi:hypothetical protein